MAESAAAAAASSSPKPQIDSPSPVRHPQQLQLQPTNLTNTAATLAPPQAQTQPQAPNLTNLSNLSQTPQVSPSPSLDSQQQQQQQQPIVQQQQQNVTSAASQKDLENYSGEVSDSEVDLTDSKDDELYYTSPSPKLQFRSNVSRARWDDEMGMAQVIEQKGKMWITTGIVRAGLTYCSLEETLYLVEIGGMVLLSDNDSCVSLKDLYMKISQEKSGCCWELYAAYRHLKSLGYIVQRRGVPWSVKGVISNYSSIAFHGSSGDVKKVDTQIKDMTAEMLANLHFDELRLVFDVYLPNSKFKKSAPGDPAFLVCLSRGDPPSRVKLETLERQCGGIPLKICQVDHGHASFFSIEKVELPVLP